MSAEVVFIISPVMSLPNLPTPYRKLLHSISQELTDEFLEQLKLLLKIEEDQGEGFTQSDIDTITNGSQFILKMEERKILSKVNLFILRNCLYTINRMDLVDRINAYLINIPQDGGG